MTELKSDIALLISVNRESHFFETIGKREGQEEGWREGEIVGSGWSRWGIDNITKSKKTDITYPSSSLASRTFQDMVCTRGTGEFFLP